MKDKKEEHGRKEENRVGGGRRSSSSNSDVSITVKFDRIIKAQTKYVLMMEARLRLTGI
jgi:hypothetical protein